MPASQKLTFWKFGDHRLNSERTPAYFWDSTAACAVRGQSFRASAGLNRRFFAQRGERDGDLDGPFLFALSILKACLYSGFQLVSSWFLSC